MIYWILDKKVKVTSFISVLNPSVREVSNSPQDFVGNAENNFLKFKFCQNSKFKKLTKYQSRLVIKFECREYWKCLKMIFFTIPLTYT